MIQRLPSLSGRHAGKTKTGLKGQGMTLKPGEFSNLVQL